MLVLFCLVALAATLPQGDETGIHGLQDWADDLPVQGRSLFSAGKSSFTTRIFDSEELVPNLVEVQSSIVLTSDEGAEDGEMATSEVRLTDTALQAPSASAGTQLPKGAVLMRCGDLLASRGAIAVLILAYLFPLCRIVFCASVCSVEAKRCKKIKNESCGNGEREDLATAVPAAAAPAAPVAAPAAALLQADGFDVTPLHLAAQQGELCTAVALLEAGADVDAKDAWGETPLHFAARSGNTAVCKSLLEHGAEINAINDSSFTPLWEAALAGHKATCCALLTCGGHVGELPDEELPPVLVTLMVSQMVSGDGTN